MIAEHNGQICFRLRGRGWKPLDDITAAEAIMLLGEIERLMTRLDADAVLVRDLARRKQGETPCR